MEDGLSSSLCAADRLERLNQRQAAWDELTWAEDKCIETLTGQVWELYGGVLALSTADRRTLSFRQLPSHHRGIEEKTWTVDVSNLNLRDFTIDPSQDLLVIVGRPRRVYVSTYLGYSKQQFCLDSICITLPGHHLQKLG